MQTGIAYHKQFNINKSMILNRGIALSHNTYVHKTCRESDTQRDR